MTWSCPRFVAFRRLFFLCLFTLAPLYTLEALSAPVALLQQINHVAGIGAPGFSGDGVAATTAAVNLPQGVALDGGGNLYIADTANNRIRRVDAVTGVITTVVGNGQQGYAGDGALAIMAQLNHPAGIAVDAYGNLYIADTGNSVIRKVAAATGEIATIAGNGTAGYAGDGGLATAAELNLPAALAVDASGNILIADSANNRIRFVDAASGRISLYAGNGSTTYNGDGLAATQAALSNPQGVALDSSDNLYLTDTGHNLVREVVTSTGEIQIVAGTAGQPGGFGGDGGPATSALLNAPTGLTLDTSGNLYVSDSANARIREVSAGTITTLAGNGTAGFNNTDGALATTAQVNHPVGLAVNAGDAVYVADTANNAVRLISDGRHFSIAPLSLTTPVTRYLYLQVNSSLTLNALSVSIGEAQKKEFSLGVVSSPPAFSIGTLTACAANGAYSVGSICIVPLTFAPGYPGERAAALSVATSAGTEMYGLSGAGLGPETVLSPGIITSILTTSSGQPTYEQLAIDAQGDVYVANKMNNQIDVWCAGVNASNGCASSGSSNVFVGSSDAIVTATLNAPTAVALDAAENLYIANSGANNILRVDAATHAVTTVAGNGTQGYTGDGGAATSAELHTPSGVAATADGTLYIADTGNNVARRVDAVTGIITTVAGIAGPGGYSGDGGLAIQAMLNNPFGVTLGDHRHLYIADTNNSVIRSVDPVTGIIRTVAGTGGVAGFSGDGGVAMNALLAFPLAVVADAAGNLYIADTGNARIRRVDAANGTIETIAGSNQPGFAGDGGASTLAELAAPSGVGMDALGQVVLADQTNSTVRSITALSPASLSFGDITAGCGVSAPQTVELANVGNAPLNVTALTAPTDFPLVNSNANTCVANVPQSSGSVCAMTFAFAPTVPGNLQETASETDNTLNLSGAVHQIEMSGVGQPLSVIATTTTVTANPVSLAYGAPVVLTATVTSAQGPVPSGTVLFSINGLAVGNAALNGAGVASLTIPAAPTGTNVLVLASHPQQCTYGPSVALTSMTVVPAATQTTLISSVAQVLYGQSMTLEAIVTSVTSGTPTGVVVFMDGSSQIGQATLDGTGYATVVLNQQALPLGMNTFTAQYLGDPNYISSTSNSVGVTVSDASLQMDIHPTQVQLSAGASGQIQITLTPLHGFDQTVTLSCAGLVAGAECIFAPATIAFNAQSQAQQITLTIRSNLLAVAGAPFGSGRWMPLGWLMLAFTVLAAALLQRARKQADMAGCKAVRGPHGYKGRSGHNGRSGWMLVAILCLGGCASLAALTGCSGSAPPPPIYSTVMVQASTPSQGVLAQWALQVDLGQ